MSVVGTYQGVNIIALPTDPAPKQIEITMNSVVAAPANPFSGASLQVLAWPGGDFWTAQIALPKLTQEQIPVWSAFLAEVRGKLNVFALGDSSYQGVRGNVQGAPVVNGAQSPMVFTLNTKGWTPNVYRLLLPGDYFQLGHRLHRVTETVNSDASGNATINFWPSLRDTVADGQSINFIKPTGLFRMADNKLSMTIDETRMGAVSFNVVEAR